MSMKIALAGNPNSGKTTMFNHLTGSNQYVGNWPGVTVEKKEGGLKGYKDVSIIDLPGIYSLSPYTLEEVVSRNYLLSEKPDAIINIVDGTNIERNLYLTTQLTELGIPVVVALNMMDVFRKNGDKIDVEKLKEELGCEIVETSALKGTGCMDIAKKAMELGSKKEAFAHRHTFAKEVEDALDEISDIISGKIEESALRWYAVKLFENDEKVWESIHLDVASQDAMKAVIARLEEELDDDTESIIANERYNYISTMIHATVKKGKKSIDNTSDKIDRVVTNRILALPIFAIVMFLVYYISITTVGDLVTTFTNDTVFGDWISGSLAGMLENAEVTGWLVGLIVDGIVAGVGAVIGFVPQMFILFFMLAILEECGYMARVAFIMDRVFRRFGLSGKSFIPLLIGSGCSVPGIMASRTIEQERDRRMTIMTTSFIPCGAKMPIIALIAGALFGGAWWVAPSAYFVGIAAVIISGVILKKTKVFSGEPAPFVMELPPYHMPTTGNVFRSTWERGWSFIKRAGTLILVSSVLIWFLSSFGFAEEGFGMVEDLNESVLSNIGGMIAPLFAPLGFGNWQSTVATVLGLLAKEEIVGVFGVLFGITGDAINMVEEGAFDSLSGIATHFTMLTAYSFMIFNLLCAPCIAAIGAIKREMNSTKWLWIAIGYQTGFAYAISLMVYQFGMFFTGNGFGVGTAVATVLLAIMLYLLFRPYKEAKATMNNNISKVNA